MTDLRLLDDETSSQGEGCTTPPPGSIEEADKLFSELGYEDDRYKSDCEDAAFRGQR